MLRSLVHQHPGIDLHHVHQQVLQLEERQQLWFGTPAHLIAWIEQHQARVDINHFVFWLDFGGMPPTSVQRSMRLLAEEVLPHFRT